jgi:hypothetical protein
MNQARRRKGSGAFDLIEQATHLLRTAPAATLAAYYLATIPFVLGLLFFWADMSRSPFANQHLSDASLGMGVLFLCMKFGQTLFLRRIWAQLAAQPPPPLRFRSGIRVLLAQTIVQPTGLFIIPLALVPTLPFPWVYAFYQNITALSDGEETMPALFKKSWRQAALWPKQNMTALGILTAFAIYVFLNWVIVCLALPGLLKMLLGIQTSFSQSPWGMLNSTFFAAMVGLTYLCVDPLVKTFYALRCFYGESLQSGEDLKAELKQFSSTLPKIAAILILAAFFCLPRAMAADPTPASNPQTPAQVSTPQLDQAINQTIHEDKYAWRMPRAEKEDADADEGPVGRFFDKMGEMLKRWAKAVAHWLGELWRKLFGGRREYSSNTSSGYGWIWSVQMLLWVLVAVVACTLAVFISRIWINRRKSALTATSTAILPVPDVADENVGADELPEEGWTKLARELLARGELRLAMRAFYLASLSHLAARNLISIARFKSNREYERELRRRGHSFPEVLSIFGQNISVFEGIWYGMHDVSPDSVSQFASNVERIKTAR